MQGKKELRKLHFLGFKKWYNFKSDIAIKHCTCVLNSLCRKDPEGRVSLLSKNVLKWVYVIIAFKFFINVEIGDDKIVIWFYFKMQ